MGAFGRSFYLGETEMKKSWLISLVLVVLLSTGVYAFPPTAPQGASSGVNDYTVATLPAGPLNTVVVVTDGTTSSDCTVGGGSTRVMCVYTGAAWTAVGDGTGGAGSGSMTTVQQGGIQVGDADIVTLNFDAAAFAITEPSNTTIAITMDLTPSSGNATLINEEDAIQVKYDAVVMAEGTSGLTLDLTPSSGSATLIAEEDALQVKYDSTYLAEGANGLTIASTSLTNTQIATAAAIAWSKMAALTSAQILVGNVSNVAVDVAVSGDVTMANTGAVTIGDNKILESMLKAVDSASDEDILTYESTTGDFEWHSMTEMLSKIGDTRGSILYKGASAWSALTPGTVSYPLVSAGAGADPAYSQIVAAGIANNTITATQLSATLTFADGDILDLSGITMSAGADEGLALPTYADVAPTTEKFYAAYDASNNAIMVRESGGWVNTSAGTGAATNLNFIVTSAEGSLTAESVLTAGLGIDVTDAGGDGGAVTIDFDPTEITGNRTWAAGADATVAWTWNVTTGTDPTLTFGNDLITSSNSVTIATGKHLTLGTTQWDNGSDKIDGEQIADDTIDDDAIDWSDVTAADITMTDAGAITASGLITGSAGVTVATGQHLTVGTTQWDNGSDSIDGDKIANDTIDDESIDFGSSTNQVGVADFETAESINILLETEIDASSELRAIMDDETGEGVLVFGTSPTFTTSVNMGSSISKTDVSMHDAGTIIFYDDGDNTTVTFGPVGDGTTVLGVTGTINATGLQVGGSAVINAASKWSGGDLGGTGLAPTVTDLTISGEAQGEVLYFNGSICTSLDVGANGKVLTTHGAGASPTWESVTATPGGDGSPAGQVQYESSGNLAGEDAFYYTAATNVLTVGNVITSGYISAGSSPADVGEIRMSNTDSIEWETAIAGTNLSIAVDANNDMLLTTAATDFVQITTGNLKVGDGTPGQTLDGEDLYVNGLAEIDGVLYSDGGISNAGTLTMSANSAAITHSGSTTLAISSTSGTVSVEGTTFTGNDASIAGDVTVVGADVVLISSTAGAGITGGDGTLTLKGLGSGTDETMTIDLNSSNLITIASGTSATFAFTPAVGFTAATTHSAGIVIADSQTLTFDESAIDPNDADVVFSATDGVLTIAAANGANNENITIDLDAASNVVTFNSGTSATFTITPNTTITGTLSAGAAGFSVDPDGDTIVKSLTVTKVNGVASTSLLYEATTTETNGVGWKGPASRASDLYLQFSDSDPAINQFMLFPAPTTGTSTAVWTTYGSPPSADGLALGSATAEWSDLFLADGGVIYFQNDQSVYLTPSASTLTLTGAFVTTGAVTPSAANGAALGSATNEWADLFLHDGAVIYGQADQSATLTSSASLWTANAFATTGAMTVGTSLVPDAADGATIGSASAEWSDIYLADGGVIYFQNDQSVYLTPSAGTLTLTGAFAATSITSSPSATPTMAFKDSDATAGDVNANIVANCTDTGDGTEDCDITISQQIAGTLTAALTFDADGNITFGTGRTVAATAFSGPLTGNVTGNASGSAATLTGTLASVAASTSANLSTCLSDENTTNGYMTDPMTGAGDIIVGGASGVPARLAAGATTEILVGGGAAAPVWTTATGTGAPVRATSPTLVTPVIGAATGTSLSLTGVLTGLAPSVNVLVPSGTSTDVPSETVLTHTDDGSAANAYVGMTLYNITDAVSGTVTASDSTTITVAAGSMSWADTNVYQLGPGPSQSGSIFYVGTAGTIRHPATAGYVAGYYVNVAGAVVVDMASDSMVFQGVVSGAFATLDAGDCIESPATKGSFYMLHNKSATEAIGFGSANTWIDGGAS